MKSHVVKVDHHTKDTIKDMFAWCSLHCTKDYGRDGTWGTSWWTEKSNTEFHFLNEEDAIMFKMMF